MSMRIDLDFRHGLTESAVTDTAEGGLALVLSRGAETVVVHMSLPSVDATHVFLIVEEGDNTPLALPGARLLLPAFRIRLFRERDQSLRLAYGRADLAPPSYDLALLAPRVFGVSAVDVPPGPERDERAGGAAAIVSPWLFWGILVGAVIVLLGLIARLVRKPAA